jgi:F-type H+-transporting ATPase subunit b
VNFSATLLGQSISFLIFVAICMKFVWPPIMAALADRQKKIADGLEAAGRASRDLELAQKEAAKYLHEAKSQAADIIEQAKRRAAQMVDDAKEHAHQEAERVKQSANSEIEQASHQAKEKLRIEVSKLALLGAEKVLSRSVDASVHDQLLTQLAAEL